MKVGTNVFAEISNNKIYFNFFKETSGKKAYFHLICISPEEARGLHSG